MTDKPDFSRDTGPGRPGIDNVHIPGQSYRSHQVEDTGCRICRKEVGYWEHDGIRLYGTEGQNKTYVWTIPTSQIPGKCTICCDCLQPYIERGDLELYVDATGELLEDVSEAATKVLFMAEARNLMADFTEYQPDRPTSDFRLPITDDEIHQIMCFANRKGGMRSVHDAGEEYALAALAFDKVLKDPNFEAAAKYYAETWRVYQLFGAEDETFTEEMLLRQLLES